MKRELMIVFSVSLLLLFSLSFVSANWFTDLFRGDVQLSPQDCSDGCSIKDITTKWKSFSVDGEEYSIRLLGANSKAETNNFYVKLGYNPAVKTGYIKAGESYKFNDNVSVRLVEFHSKRPIVKIDVSEGTNDNCGNGYLEETEQCDLGKENGKTDSYCSSECTAWNNHFYTKNGASYILVWDTIAYEITPIIGFGELIAKKYGVEFKVRSSLDTVGKTIILREGKSGVLGNIRIELVRVLYGKHPEENVVGSRSDVIFKVESAQSKFKKATGKCYDGTFGTLEEVCRTSEEWRKIFDEMCTSACLVERITGKCGVNTFPINLEVDQGSSC